MLPFIGRPWKTKTRTQSSEHGVVATGKHVDLSGCLFVERHVWLLSAPEVMEQHGQLACYCDDGLTLGLHPPRAARCRPHCRSAESRPSRSEYMVGALDQQTSKVCVAGVGDAKLRIMISGLTSAFAVNQGSNPHRDFRPNRSLLPSVSTKVKAVRWPTP